MTQALGITELHGQNEWFYFTQRHIGCGRGTGDRNKGVALTSPGNRSRGPTDIVAEQQHM